MTEKSAWAYVFFNIFSPALDDIHGEVVHNITSFFVLLSVLTHKVDRIPIVVEIPVTEIKKSETKLVAHAQVHNE